ncbi:LuxR C-terminal-related transcriptional regulator [Acidisoma silvae]|uniref:Response regulator transcription factor n=1 Tax=Acidisoma silvae TaxID=2802396 RepID=A0A964E1B2_9PROT|nr:LuxR C-terminal-related transcriptional regulator [Acidisoma silvae]MCB8878176.1 response regulator transcription factor [Acidisoma silvae]
MNEQVARSLAIEEKAKKNLRREQHPMAESMDEYGVHNIAIAWIDDSKLSQEIYSITVKEMDSAYEIEAFDSVETCVAHQDRTFDIVVFYSHEVVFKSFQDIMSLRKSLPTSYLVIVSDELDVDSKTIDAALTCGVSAYISSCSSDMKIFSKTLALVGVGGVAVPRGYSGPEAVSGDLTKNEKNLSVFTRDYLLTKREAEILGYLWVGETERYVAEKLRINIMTVKMHIRNVMRKAGDKNPDKGN